MSFFSQFYFVQALFIILILQLRQYREDTFSQSRAIRTLFQFYELVLAETVVRDLGSL